MLDVRDGSDSFPRERDLAEIELNRWDSYGGRSFDIDLYAHAAFEALPLIREGSDDPQLSENYGEHELVVNTDAPASVLIEAFKEWLEATQAASRPRAFSDKDIQRWNDNRLLLAIDIELYARLKNNKLTYLQIANLLYPDEFEIDSVQKVRQTTLPNAKKLLSEKVILAMHAQCVAEGDKNP